MRQVDRIELFSKLEEEDKENLESSMRTQKYNKGENIFLEYDPADKLYFVLEGVVTVSLGQRPCYIAHKGEILGLEGVLSDDHLHPFAAKAEVRTRLITLSSSVFLKLFDEKIGDKFNNGRNAHLLKTILVHTNRRLHQSFDKINALTGGGRGAVADMLNNLIIKGEYIVTERGKKITVKLSEERIAAYCRCHRSTVQRALSQLIKEKIIEKSYRTITVLDSDRLQELLDE